MDTHVSWIWEFVDLKIATNLNRITQPQILGTWLTYTLVRFCFDHPTYLLFLWPPIPSSPSCQTPSFLNFSLPESTSCWICHQIREFPSGFPDKLPISAKTLKFVNILPNEWENSCLDNELMISLLPAISPIPHSSIGSDRCSYHYVHTGEGIHERGMK